MSIRNSSGQKFESISNVNRHHNQKHLSSSSSNEDVDECFNSHPCLKNTLRSKSYNNSSNKNPKRTPQHISNMKSHGSSQDQCFQSISNKIPITSSPSSATSSPAAGSAVVVQSLSTSLSSSSSTLSTSKTKHGNQIGSTELCHTPYAIPQTKSAKTTLPMISKPNSLPISSTLSPSTTQSSSKADNAKKLSISLNKPKKRRTKGHPEKSSSKLQSQEAHSTACITPQSNILSVSQVREVPVPFNTGGYITATTSNDDSCSGGGGDRKESTSSSSTGGSCTNLASQDETKSFIISDTVSTLSKSKLAGTELVNVETESIRPSLSSYCSATEDDVSTIK